MSPSLSSADVRSAGASIQAAPTRVLHPRLSTFLSAWRETACLLELSASDGAGQLVLPDTAMPALLGFDGQGLWPLTGCRRLRLVRERQRKHLALQLVFARDVDRLQLAPARADAERLRDGWEWLLTELFGAEAVQAVQSRRRLQAELALPHMGAAPGSESHD